MSAMPDEDKTQPQPKREQTEYERFEELARKAFQTPKPADWKLVGDSVEAEPEGPKGEGKDQNPEG